MNTTRTPAMVMTIAGVGLGLALLASLFLGGKTLEPAQILRTLGSEADPYVQTVLSARISRTIIGLLCGAALAGAGVVIQGITRNPLGDPGLLGITVGAGAAVVTATALTGRHLAGYSWIALTGALATVIVVYSLSVRSSSGHVTLVLTGAVVSAVLTAYIQAIILSYPAVFDSFRFWMVGSLSGRGLDTALSAAPILLPGFILAFVLTPSLNNLALGDDVATSLGTPVRLVKGLGILAVAFLAGAATAAAGPISFIGLVVPHLARSLVGADHRRQLPLALVLGATLLIGADVTGRLIARPEEVLAGIVTALVGAPFLLAAVRAGWATR
ncbi:FecCD family ABC transporter permease [Trueperella pyogenes]|uniref:FecCD family ABC transporter permease n=1 Tax=Trueperella pyogenes TaxID=1661 RepID=UPI00345D8A5D